MRGHRQIFNIQNLEGEAPSSPLQVHIYCNSSRKLATVDCRAPIKLDSPPVVVHSTPMMTQFYRNTENISKKKIHTNAKHENLKAYNGK